MGTTRACGCSRSGTRLSASHDPADPWLTASDPLVRRVAAAVGRGGTPAAETGFCGHFCAGLRSVRDHHADGGPSDGRRQRGDRRVGVCRHTLLRAGNVVQRRAAARRRRRHRLVLGERPCRAGNAGSTAPAAHPKAIDLERGLLRSTTKWLRNWPFSSAAADDAAVTCY